MFDNKDVNDISTMVPAPKKEHCKLSKMEFNDELNTLDILFHDSTGAQLRERIFEPTDKSAEPPFEGYDFAKSKQQIQSRIAHILNRYIKEEATKSIKGDTWKQYCNNVIAAMPKDYDKIDCSLKVVYNKKGFVSLPQFPDFISTKFSPKEFKADPRYDNFTKEISSDTESDEVKGAKEKEVF